MWACLRYLPQIATVWHLAPAEFRHQVLRWLDLA